MVIHMVPAYCFVSPADRINLAVYLLQAGTVCLFLIYFYKVLDRGSCVCKIINQMVS